MNDSPADDASQFVEFFTHRQWLPLAALVAMYLTRMVGIDAKFVLFGKSIDIPGNWKPYVLLVLGAITAVLDKVVSGSSWNDAAGAGIGLVVLSLLTHNYVVQPTGKDLPLPKALKKDDGEGPPPGGPDGPTVKKRITFSSDSSLLGMVFGTMVAVVIACSVITLSLLPSGCTPAQRARVLPVLSAVDAIGEQAAHLLGYCEQHLPEGDAQVAAAKAAQAARDFGRVYELVQPMLERIAQGGESVPTDIAAQQVTGALAARGIEQGMRALDGRDADGNKKPAPAAPPQAETP